MESNLPLGRHLVLMKASTAALVSISWTPRVLGHHSLVYYLPLTARIPGNSTYSRTFPYPLALRRPSYMYFLIHHWSPINGEPSSCKPLWPTISVISTCKMTTIGCAPGLQSIVLPFTEPTR
ncbi:hypothetical protein C8Q70DRAFT_711414 [Cubamyces menziesii]|nr:hypothetical protein C8Q70DRAFT_711414 [Cubamyces menziesii]